MDDSIVVAAFGMVAIPVASFVTWFLNRRKSKAEEVVSIVTASGEAVDAINDVLSVLREENKELAAEIAELKRQNGLLVEENRKLASEITELKSLIEEMSRKLQ